MVGLRAWLSNWGREPEERQGERKQCTGAGRNKKKLETVTQINGSNPINK